MFSQLFGTNSVAPRSTAAMAGAARGFIFTYHWVLSMGSTMAPPRWLRPSFIMCFFAPRSRPSSAMRAFTAVRASKRSMPVKGAAFSFMHAASSKMLMTSRSWRLPT